MIKRKDIKVTSYAVALSSNFNGAGTIYSVMTPAGVIYKFFVFYNTTDGNILSYTKSLDYGITWTNITTVSLKISITMFAVWYDRWSGINADLIHLTYVDTADDFVTYRNINAADSDSMSSEYSFFDGVSTAGNSTMSLTRTRGGNLICGGTIDSGSELFCYKSTNVGVNWTSIAAVSEEIADMVILLPGWAADNQDAMCFYYDESTAELSRKLYDDSVDSWGETTISSSISWPVSTSGYPNFSAVVDITNSRNILVAWSAVDTVNADLRCWYITESAITEVTNVVLNSADDQALCAICIDVNTDYWYAFYGGKSDGSETVGTAINIYYRCSKDNGTTWGEETLLTNKTYNVLGLYSVPRFYNHFIVDWYDGTTPDSSFVSGVIKLNRAEGGLGL